MPLDNKDIQLVQDVSDFLKLHYKKNVHHVASAIVSENGTYYGLHLDTSGYDVCAEPIAISNALMAGETNFNTVVAVHWDGDPSQEPIIIAPCGDCRQTLIEYAPDAEVIVGGELGLEKVSMTSLLPNAYIKPRTNRIK